MLDAITGLKTAVAAVREPAPADRMILRCEHRGATIDEHFGYFVACSRNASKEFAALKRKLRKLARKKRGGWRSAFEAPASFAFLSRSKRCYGQVAGRLLLQRPDLGERIAAEMDRNLFF
jgi:hypothetical protein